MQDDIIKRTRHVGIRFTLDEYARLEARARDAGVEISSFLRMMAVDAPIPRQARRQAPDIVALGRLMTALNKIGNNINQISRQAHVTGDLRAYHEAQQDRTLLAAAAQAVINALDS